MASFSPVLEETIHRALTLASERKHELATLEHLLLALLDDKDAAAVITACDVDIEPLRADVIRYLDEDLSSLVVEDFEEARTPLIISRTALANLAMALRQKRRSAQICLKAKMRRKKIRSKNIRSI